MDSQEPLLEWVMLGDSMLSFVPLHNGAIDTQTGLLDWINTWSIYENMKLMKLEEWFVEGPAIVGYGVNYVGVRIPLLRSGSFVCSSSGKCCSGRTKESETQEAVIFSHMYMSKKVET